MNKDGQWSPAFVRGVCSEGRGGERGSGRGEGSAAVEDRRKSLRGEGKRLLREEKQIPIKEGKDLEGGQVRAG